MAIRPSRNGDAEFGPDPKNLDAALQELFARASVDPERVVLIGFSDGASYALSLGLATPRLFRCIIALSPGYLWMPPSVDRSQRSVHRPWSARRDPAFLECDGDILPDLEKAGLRPRTRWFNGGHTVDQAAVNEALDFALGPSASLERVGAGAVPR